MKGIKILVVLFSPLAAGWISLFLGAYEISPFLVLKILLNETLSVFEVGDLPEKAIVWDIRFPRVLTAFLVGASLSGAGVTLQALFRNPLVDPFILGISAGAAFGCAITIGFLEIFPIQLMAFFFAILAVFLACFIAKTQGEISRLPLVLSGVIVSAFFTALVSMVKFLVDPHKLQSIVYWLMGSFSLADWRTLKWIVPGILVGLIPVYLMRWRLNVLSMGEEEAKMLGINVGRERALLILFSTLAVATATSACGIIGWVGLMVPHLIRMLIGPDHKVLLPLALAGGGAFMIAADTLSRTLTSFDIPVGIITALTGAPFFIYLMKKGGKEAWGK
ncbi:MAG: iron ABC transporter permease [Thermodesulfobacteriaceae bacterium]|nr:iron ABC transporter permease [Thermodesulfobacteriaceae bacterium]MDW8136477.1 iron ABC transporter permease [Thermodesulfobacterium sp.]